MYSLHTPRNEEREEIFSTAGALCLGPAFTALSLVYPHFSIGDISFLGTRQGDCPTVDPSLGVQGASKHLYLRESRSLSSLLSPLSPPALDCCFLSASAEAGDEGSGTWNETCLSYVLPWDPPVPLSFAFSFLWDWACLPYYLV